MVVHILVLGLVLAVADGQGGPARSAADKITLRDGSVVAGLVTAATTGPHGSVEILVRRAWAETHQKQHLREWDRATAATSRQALVQRRRRLEAWRRERSAGAGAVAGAGARARADAEPEDRIAQWIDRELARLTAPGGPAPSTLLPVKLPRSDVRALDRTPAGSERMLRLAWLCALPEPESIPSDRLKDALENRGYAMEAVRAAPPASLDALLPPSLESDAQWMMRRAATEVTIDSGARFIRFQDTILPDAGPGQDLGGVGLSTAVSELKRLFDVDNGPKADPLEEKLNTLADKGRVGAVVTQLAIQPDFSSVTVESTLWVRAMGNRWVPAGFRNATVRPDDLERQAGQNLAEDPQVKGAFRVVEMLGLGAIPPELKERSLRIGAATEKALGTARSAFNEYLDLVALPVLAPPTGEPARAGAGGEPSAR